MTSWTTPRDSGLRPAPAWLKPGRFWLAWPRPTGDRDSDEARREDCLGLAELLSDHAPVSLICSSADVGEISLRTPPDVAAMVVDHDGSALRRHAPLWLVDSQDRLAGAVAFGPLGRQMAEMSGVPVVDAPPGLPTALETDGEGTALVSAMLNDVVASEQLLRDWLGLEHLVWLADCGAEGTSPGACFLAPGLVALAQHPANYQLLEATVDAKGRRLTLVELPIGKKRDGNYADCVVAGSAVVVPDFEDGRGTEAFNRVSSALSDRMVNAFPATWLAPQGAGLGALVVVQPAL